MRAIAPSSPHAPPDVCIVGSGPSGAMAARILAARGCRVLVLERGIRTPAGTTFDQGQGDRERAFVTTETGDRRAIGDPWTASTVGGGMEFYDGISFRYQPVDFDASRHIQGDLDPRWPIGPAALAPHYAAVEDLVGIAGDAATARATGVDGVLPLPAHGLAGRARALAEAARRLGMAPFPAPTAINSRARNGRPACDASNGCDGLRCPSGAKASVTALGLLSPWPGDRGSIELRTGALATRLIQSRTGRVDGVDYIDLASGTPRSVHAEQVILAANAVQSAALLLRSRTRWQPRGIGNETDLVGRGLSFKVSAYIVGTAAAWRADPVIGAPYRGPHCTVALLDHYVDPACPTGLGGVIYDAHYAEPDRNAGVLRLHVIAGEHPLRSNRVAQAPERNAQGIRRLAFDYRPAEADLRRLAYLTARAKAIVREAGAERVWIEPSHYRLGSSHLHGTTRAGDDPASAVVDADGRVHGMDNLHVVDGGYMPFAGGLNPTHTIMANARRIALSLATSAAAAERTPSIQEA